MTKKYEKERKTNFICCDVFIWLEDQNKLSFNISVSSKHTICRLFILNFSFFKCGFIVEKITTLLKMESDKVVIKV